MATRDPLKSATAQYGRQAAAWIVTALEAVPADERDVALTALLDAVDPQLIAAVTPTVAKLRRAGLRPADALERALAITMAGGIELELEAAGRRAMRGEPAFKPRGQLAMRTAQAQATAQYEALDALGLSIGGIGRAIGGAAQDAGGAIARGGRAAAGFVKDGAKKLGGLACNVVNNDSAIAAVSVANPAAGAGAVAARGACPAPKSATSAASAATMPYGAPRAPRSSLPSWALPAAAAGGGLLLLLLLRKA